MDYQGGYSQILINGRPIFSPLIGMYGMDQIPSNMIDRIEIVRGSVSHCTDHLLLEVLLMYYKNS